MYHQQPYEDGTIIRMRNVTLNPDEGRDGFRCKLWLRWKQPVARRSSFGRWPMFGEPYFDFLGRTVDDATYSSRQLRCSSQHYLNEHMGLPSSLKVRKIHAEVIIVSASFLEITGSHLECPLSEFQYDKCHRMPITASSTSAVESLDTYHVEREQVDSRIRHWYTREPTKVL